MFNYDEMKQLSNDKEFFLVLKDGGQVPMANMVKKGKYYRGTNTINDVAVKVLIEDVGGYFYIDDESPESNQTYQYIHKHYQTVADMYKSENLAIDGPHFYSTLTPSKKVICGILDKFWDEIL